MAREGQGDGKGRTRQWQGKDEARQGKGREKGAIQVGSLASSRKGLSPSSSIANRPGECTA